MLPVAGPPAYDHQPMGPNNDADHHQPPQVCLNLEVYFSPKKKMLWVQQRGLCTNPRAFGQDLMSWVTQSCLAKLVVLAGADNTFQKDHQLGQNANVTSGQQPLYYYSTAGLSKSRLSFDCIPMHPPLSMDGIGLASILIDITSSAAVDPKFELLTFVRYCAEGDNVMDALAFAGQVNEVLDTGFTRVSVPPTWDRLYGNQSLDEAVFH